MRRGSWKCRVLRLLLRRAASVSFGRLRGRLGSTRCYKSQWLVHLHVKASVGFPSSASEAVSPAAPCREPETRSPTARERQSFELCRWSTHARTSNACKLVSSDTAARVCVVAAHILCLPSGSLAHSISSRANRRGLGTLKSHRLPSRHCDRAKISRSRLIAADSIWQFLPKV